jgi:two-component system sensor histidine kinase UhpB
MASTSDKECFTHRVNGDPPHLYPAALIDLLIIAGTVFFFYILAAYTNLAEKVAGFTQGYEHWQLDELPLTLLLLSACLSWFAFRRTREFHRELTERVRAQNRITELLNHNRELSQSLILIQENERQALARELHDEFGQNCTAIRAEASFIMHAPVSNDVEVSALRISEAAVTLSAMIGEILRRLRPPSLDSLGLESALQELSEAWELQTGIACGLLTRDVPSQISDSMSIAIFRLVQEALTNITRHAKATQVRITLHPTSSGEKLSLMIRDDGRGMSNPEGLHQGFGIIGMRERVAALHGDIRFFTESEGGLHIAVELPLDIPAL